MLADVPGARGADKAALRRQVLARRAGVSPAERLAAGESITRRVLILPEAATAATVAAYWALADEVPTQPLLAALLHRRATVLLPELQDDASVAWRTYAGLEELQPGRRGTTVPLGAEQELSLADVVVVPGLAFDVDGRRLGRGGGSFDRALAELSRATPTIGLAYDEDVLDEVPTAPHDVRVAIVITPTRVIRGAPR